MQYDTIWGNAFQSTRSFSTTVEADEDEDDDEDVEWGQEEKKEKPGIICPLLHFYRKT